MEGKVADLSRLDSKILECLRIRVDLLVNELPLHLIGTDGGPPEELVEIIGHWLQQGLGNVDVTAVLDDLTVNKLGNLRGGVVLRAVELKSLPSSSVIV